MDRDERLVNPHGAPVTTDVDPADYVNDDVPVSDDTAGVDPADSEDLEYQEDRPRP